MAVAYRKHKCKLRLERSSNHWASTHWRAHVLKIWQQEALVRVSNIASEDAGVCGLCGVVSD
jgi:hypothetical protein